MPKQKNLRELFHDTLKEIYFAEKKILTALPKMAKAAQSEELKEAFQKHESETEEHVKRLDQVFAELDAKPSGKTCDAIVGIIEEGQEVMKEYKESPALDAGLLAAAQAVEHYEISRYGTLKTWAQELGLEEAVELLDTTLAEEKKTDELLTEIAESWRCVSSGRGPAPTWSDVRDLVVSGESGDEPDINESTRLTDVGHQQAAFAAGHTRGSLEHQSGNRPRARLFDDIVSA
jgi:ferritin-like metal-binding protein YciE